jgi:endonuclease/exonuclease/phosphatase family metal-dependent hydrolase
VGRERLIQANALLGPDWLAHDGCRSPVIMLGDFNAIPGSRVYRLLAARLRDAQRSPNVSRASPTFPSRYPALRIDHVFVDRTLEVLTAATVRTPLARLASDHLPLVVELRLAEHRAREQDAFTLWSSNEASRSGAQPAQRACGSFE